MIRRLAAFLALFAVGTLNAQAAPQRPYPSLAKRPAESVDRFAEQPAPTEQQAPAPSDPALVTEVAALTQKASDADSAFKAQLAGGRKAVNAAEGSAVSSESWVTAQMAISALDAARYESIASLASLDTLHIERAAAQDVARGTADIAAIDPARMQVLALVDSQNDALDSLRKALKTP